MKARIEFKPQDCWIGAFWKTQVHFETGGGSYYRVDLWICLIPMIPLHLWWRITRSIDL
jgi:hypothetical protein